LIVGIVLLVVGLPSVVIGIVLVVRASRVPDENALARGSVGGGPMTFQRDDAGRITVYLRSTSTNSERIDDEVSDTTCQVAHAGGTSTIDGGHQGLSVTIGHTGTIGYVDVEAGQVTVRCDGSSSSGDRLIVASGGPPNIVVGIVLIIAGGLAFIAGLVLAIVGAVLSASRRRRGPPMPYASG
jgi:hypothetical protein